MRPAGIELDKLHDPADVYAPGSPLWDVYKTYRDLDLHLRGLPEVLGGLGGDLVPMATFLIAEEAGYGDAGLAISLGASSMPFTFAGMFSHVPELKQIVTDYINDKEGKMVAC